MSGSAVMLYPSRRKHLLFALLSLAFVSIPFLIPAAPLVVWISAAFFAVCALVFLLNLLPGTSYLRLTPEGFEARSLFRTWPLVRWCCVSQFQVTSASGQSMVVYDNSVDLEQNPRLSRANRFVAGTSSGLPDTYGLSAEALASLLNEWRDRYAASSS